MEKKDLDFKTRFPFCRTSAHTPLFRLRSSQNNNTPLHTSTFSPTLDRHKPSPSLFVSPSPRPRPHPRPISLFSGPGNLSADKLGKRNEKEELSLCAPSLISFRQRLRVLLPLYEVLMVGHCSFAFSVRSLLKDLG